MLRHGVAVVVGGANGLGLAIAREFAREGCSVAILDRDPRAAEAAHALVTATSGSNPHDSVAPIVARAFVVDVTEEAAVRHAADEVFKHFGRCDHVVYSAAIGSGKFGFPFTNLAPADWSRVLDVNLLGAVRIAHAFTPRMMEAKRGSFLFISSVAGQIGSQTDPPYSASKAAILNFMQCVAKDLAPHGLRANAICPGMIKTALNESVWRSWRDQQFKRETDSTAPSGSSQQADPSSPLHSFDAWGAEKIAKLIPLNRWQEPEDIAALAVFLASPRAQNITGQTMNVDGGWVM